ncbi:exported protein of unknown function [Nitrospira sp. KM1]|uniref:hypothetical protein n=1 Tax=Nitrospira sp. KM1 TaxID=1936990 RepID=UPI0013A75FD4|nr:hypothetical protein [Nitrospira sp. KM1]BCA54562.1 exported protein of unknown function [Nitrospira sp. KM1]
MKEVFRMGMMKMMRSTTAPAAAALAFWTGSLLMVSIAMASDVIEKQEVGALLSEQRPVLGTVQAVTADQIKIDIGEVQPRFVPLKQAQEKSSAPIAVGDRVIIVLNEQNLVVDFHSADTGTSQHEIVKGAIAQALAVGQETAVITSDGTETSFPIRSQVRSKLAAIPVGISAIFLIDETGQIADATFTDVQAAKQAHHQPERKSPIKAPHNQVDGMIVDPLHANRITIQTPSGSKNSYEVRDNLHQKFAALQKGDNVILLIDTENKVIDMAKPRSR